MLKDLVASSRTVSEANDQLSIEGSIKIEAYRLAELPLKNNTLIFKCNFLGGDKAWTVRLFVEWGETAQQQCTESATLHFEVVKELKV